MENPDDAEAIQRMSSYYDLRDALFSFHQGEALIANQNSAFHCFLREMLTEENGACKFVTTLVDHPDCYLDCLNNLKFALNIKFSIQRVCVICNRVTQC